MTPSAVLTLTYFTIFGIYGVMIPFLPIILHQQGLSDAEVTLALSANGLAAIFAPLLVSHFADRIYAVRHLLSFLTVSTALLGPCWLLVDTIWKALALGFFYFSLIIPALSMLDAFTVQYCRHNLDNASGKAIGFQSFRVWGSIGFMMPALALLPLSIFYAVDATLLVIISTGLSLMGALFAFCLPHNEPIKTGEALPSRQALQAALRPPLRGIFAATSIAGLSLSIFYVAFPRYLQELGNSTLLVGLIINLGVVWEILLMPWTPKLIKRYGARGLVLLGLASIPVRLFIISTWPSTATVIATQILHAPLIIGLFISVPIFLGDLAGLSFRFSLQSLNTTLVMGLSRTIGPCLGALVIGYSNQSALSGLINALYFSALLGMLAFFVLAFSSNEPKPAGPPL